MTRATKPRGAATWCTHTHAQSNEHTHPHNQTNKQTNKHRSRGGVCFKFKTREEEVCCSNLQHERTHTPRKHKHKHTHAQARQRGRAKEVCRGYKERRAKRREGGGSWEKVRSILFAETCLKTFVNCHNSQDFLANVCWLGHRMTHSLTHSRCLGACRKRKVCFCCRRRCWRQQSKTRFSRQKPQTTNKKDAARRRAWRCVCWGASEAATL